MTELPEPLTPAESDLRGMPYMPLDVVRLIDSDLYALSTGDEFKAAVTLWCKSFYQMPAGSLPDDDRLLEHLSGSKSWKKVRDMALRGWFKCCDGRLYHKTVAEKVQEAWASRLARRERTEAARAARHSAKVSCDNPPMPPFTTSVTENVTTSVTESKGTEGNRTEGKIRKKEEEHPLPPQPGAVAAGRRGVSDDPDFETFWQRYPRKVGKGQARRAWATAMGKAHPATIIARLSRQNFDSREQFIPHPSTWLNGERWLDEGQSGDPVLRAAGLLNDDYSQEIPEFLRLN